MADGRGHALPSRRLADVLRTAVQRFEHSEIETPATDARRLLCCALEIDLTRLMLDRDRLLTEDEFSRVQSLMARRLAGEPVSRIEGVRWFFGRAFEITLATLDPRADSEAIVERALAVGRDEGAVLDVGTGTGCLLLSILAEKPGLVGLGTDVSPEALAVARRNAERLKLSDRTKFSLADGLAGALELARRGDQSTPPISLIVSNPPYIPASVIPKLAREVRGHDPLLALDGGTDGLDHYRAFFATLEQASRGPLGEQVHVVLEFGDDQAAAIVALANACPAVEISSIDLIRDLGGRDRGISFSSRQR